ncbi:MAG: hypothetical protein LBS07_05675 [Prevotellaceae bacterium]|nr:hypothetical protein [Prevotellaceae bacterium]
MTYENLLQEATDDGYTVIEKCFKSRARGLCKGSRIGICQNLLSNEKLCTLAEEMGHAKLTVGNIIDQTGIGNMKQEHKARCWAYRKLVSPEDICNAVKNGCHEIYEFAEALDLPEDFLQGCIAYYKGNNAIDLPKGVKTEL